MRSILKCGIIHGILATSLVGTQTTVAFAFAPASVDHRQTQAQYERKLLHKQIEQNRILLRSLLEMQARATSPEVREAFEQRDAERLKEADEANLAGDPDFGSSVAAIFRDELRNRAEQIRQNPITMQSSEADVQQFLDRLRQDHEFAKDKLRSLQASYAEAYEVLPSSVRRTLDNRISPDALQRAGGDLLREGLAKLDPSLTPERLKVFTGSDLAREAYRFTRNGRWTPELVAALGTEGFQQVTGEQLDPKYVQTAVDLVDAHRSSADYHQFAQTAMMTAMATGNPYVIAAVAAFLLLMQLFGGMGGGGGDGDGDGDSEGSGKGRSGRNTGANVPVDERGTGGGTGDTPVTGPPGGPPDDGGAPGFQSIGGDPDGKYLVGFLSNGTLECRSKETGGRLFAFNPSEVTDENTNRQFEGRITNALSVSLDPNRLGVRMNGVAREIVQRDDGWVALAGEVIDIPGGEGDSDWTMVRDGALVKFRFKGRVFEQDEVRFEFNPATLRDQQGGTWRLDTSKIQAPFVVDTGNRLISFPKYREDDGRVVLRNVRWNGNRWEVSAPVEFDE